MRRARLAAVAAVAGVLGGLTANAGAAPLAADGPAPVAAAEAGRAGGTILMMLRAAPPRLRSGAGYGGDYGDAADRRLALRRARGIARPQGLEVVEVWPMPVLGLDCVVLRAPPGADLAPLIARLSAHPDVAWSQDMQEFASEGASVTPATDPLLGAQPAARAWRLEALHRLATGKGKRVAVIDSAVDARHPDLRGRLAAQRDFVGDGGGAGGEAHGTAIAGVVAAAANGVGIIGVAPEARILALRACREPAGGGAARCDGLALARALQAAIELRAPVINLSLGGPPDRLIAALIDVAVARGAVVVAARGARTPGGAFPASHPGVLAVAAAPHAGALVAPGTNIPVPASGGGWRLANGSSYAAAHVSGLAALALERAPHWGAAWAPVADPAGYIDACRTVLSADPAGASAPRCD